MRLTERHHPSKRNIFNKIFPQWFSPRNTIVVYSMAFFVFFLAFGINLVYWLRADYICETWDIKKCFDDVRGATPYVIPEGQSILHYDSTVIIDKNSPFSTCNWVPEGFTSNPERDCPLDSPYVLTPVIPMSSSSILKSTIDQFQKVIIDFSLNTSIISFENLSTIHCSIQYFSCYNYSEYLIIREVFTDFQWNSFVIEFDQISCDVSTVGSYLLIEADLLSQQKLFHFLRKLEKEINNRDVKIKIPRIEKFHLTLAGVHYTYPSDCMVKNLKTKFKNQPFGSVRICCFITKIGFNITYYYAKDCNQNDECVLDIQ